jgi:hypothetical protein
MRFAPFFALLVVVVAAGCGGALPDDESTKPHVYFWRASATCSMACPWETPGAFAEESRDDVANWILDQVFQYAIARGDSIFNIDEKLAVADAKLCSTSDYVTFDFWQANGPQVRFQLYTAPESGYAASEALTPSKPSN